MFKTFKANHFNISEQKRIFKSFEGNHFKSERGQKVNVENWEISLRYQIGAFRQSQTCRRAGGVESESGSQSFMTRQREGRASSGSTNGKQVWAETDQ